MMEASCLFALLKNPPVAVLWSLEVLEKYRADMDMLTVLPPNFGYAILTYLYCWFMLAYLATRVGSARKKYNVQYPTMYSDKEHMFNCIQRAHQNTLEVIPMWLVFQTIAALVYPLSASVLGAIFVTSRFSYAWGYYTGDPQKRMRSAYGYIGFFGVVILSISVALQLLGVY